MRFFSKTKVKREQKKKSPNDFRLPFAPLPIITHRKTPVGRWKWMQQCNSHYHECQYKFFLTEKTAKKESHQAKEWKMKDIESQKCMLIIECKQRRGKQKKRRQIFVGFRLWKNYWFSIFQGSNWNRCKKGCSITSKRQRNKRRSLWLKCCLEN